MPANEFNTCFFSTSFIRKISVGLLMCMVVSNASAQVSDYIFEQDIGVYNELPSGTLLGRATGNGTNAEGLYQQIYTIDNLPFDFLFNGARYNQVFVHSTGYITFGRAPVASNHLAISSNAAYSGGIQAWRSQNGFANIGGRTSELRWGIVGVAPDRELVIQWKDFRTQLASSTGIPPSNLPVPFMNYQIRLKECTNVIEIVYGESGLAYGELNSTTSAQVGLRGALNTDFNNRTNLSSVSINSSTAGGVNSAVQNHTTVNPLPGRHDNGKIYRWIPPCYESEIPATILAPSSICRGDSLTLTVSGGFLGSCAEPEWFLGSCGGIPIGSDTSITVLPQGNLTYFVRYNGECNTTACISLSESSIEMIDQPSPPVSFSGPALICSGQSALLTASGTLESGNQWALYEGDPQSGGVEVGRNTTGQFTVSPNTTTEYYVIIQGKAPCLFQSPTLSFRVEVLESCICGDAGLVVAYAESNSNFIYVERCTDIETGWTYFSRENGSADTVYFAIMKTPGLPPNGVPNGNTESFLAKVKLTVDANPLGITMNDYDQTDGSCEGNFVMRRYWNVVELSNGAIERDKYVTTRFYFPPNELEQTISRADRWANRIFPAISRNTCSPDELLVSSGLIFKTFNGVLFDHLGMIQPTTINFGNWIPTYLSSIPQAGFQQGVHFYDMSWPGFSGGGIAVRVSPINNVLPVTLMDFSGQVVKEYILLKWQTASELNNDYFLVEKSLNAIDFFPIGELPGFGTTSDPQYYLLKDIEPNFGVNYYRLRQVDYDGAYTYSKTIAVNFQDQPIHYGLVGIHPQPTKGWVSVNIRAVDDYNSVFSIFDIAGRLQLSKTLELTGGFNTFQLDFSSLPAGIYMVSYTDHSGEYHHTKFIRQN